MGITDLLSRYYEFRRKAFPRRCFVVYHFALKDHSPTPRTERMLWFENNSETTLASGRETRFHRNATLLRDLSCIIKSPKNQDPVVKF